LEFPFLIQDLGFNLPNFWQFLDLALGRFCKIRLDGIQSCRALQGLVSGEKCLEKTCYLSADLTHLEFFHALNFDRHGSSKKPILKLISNRLFE
jgi:hypothetical protein